MKNKILILCLVVSQFYPCIKSEFNAPSIFDLKSIFENILPRDAINIEKLEEYFYEELDKGFDEPTVVEQIYEEREQFIHDYIDYDETYPEVTIEFGTVRGKTMTSLFGRDFLAYQSIPYAMPPLNQLRFQMPEPWEGLWPTNGAFYDGTFLRAKCPQGSLVMPIVGGREDCLHLSIYTPSDTNMTYPVMFYIHGGAYVTGDASLYVPTKLMDRDVVVVVIQYRLGSFGFMASGTPDSPGNMGLMDQVMALRWVQKYISFFGGNPDQVTVFGESAGGASASWMMFTPLTNAEHNPGGALFKRIIAESGSALETWTLDSDPATAFDIMAQSVGCKNETFVDVPDIVDCMRAVDYRLIIEASSKMTNEDMFSGGLGFLGNCPVIQKDLLENFPDEALNNTDLIVIPEHPLILLEKGNYLHVDYMTGSVRDEGILVLALTFGGFINPHGLMDNPTFLSQGFIPGIVRAFGIPDITGSASNALRLSFLRDAEMGNWDSMNGGTVDMLGMMFLKSGLWQLAQGLDARNINNETNVYVYSFEFESDDSLYDWYFLSTPNAPIIRGITHGDELLYLFHLPSLMIDERQLNTVRRMTKLWSNFATYGNPTPPIVSDPNDEWEGDMDKWEPFSLESLQYMHMSDNFTVKYDFTLGWNYNSGLPK